MQGGGTQRGGTERGSRWHWVSACSEGLLPSRLPAVLAGLEWCRGGAQEKQHWRGLGQEEQSSAVP